MEVLNLIRRLRLREKLALHEIARRTFLSRIEAIGRHWSETNG